MLKAAIPPVPQRTLYGYISRTMEIDELTNCLRPRPRRILVGHWIAIRQMKFQFHSSILVRSSWGSHHGWPTLNGEEVYSRVISWCVQRWCIFAFCSFGTRAMSREKRRPTSTLRCIGISSVPSFQTELFFNVYFSKNSKKHLNFKVSCCRLSSTKNVMCLASKNSKSDHKQSHMCTELPQLPSGVEVSIKYPWNQFMNAHTIL